MTDIVKRLRAANTTLNEGDCCGQLDASGTCTAPACIFGEALKMTHEAADEIEKLRKALEEVRALVFGANHSETRYPLARAALKEDGDE